jgi:hypothetical protein
MRGAEPRCAGGHWTSPAGPSAIKMKPKTPSRCARIQAVEANAAAPCRDASLENGRSSGLSTNRIPERARDTAPRRTRDEVTVCSLDAEAVVIECFSSFRSMRVRFPMKTNNVRFQSIPGSLVPSTSNFSMTNVSSTMPESFSFTRTAPSAKLACLLSSFGKTSKTPNVVGPRRNAYRPSFLTAFGRLTGLLGGSSQPLPLFRI